MTAPLESRKISGNALLVIALLALLAAVDFVVYISDSADVDAIEKSVKFGEPLGEIFDGAWDSVAILLYIATAIAYIVWFHKAHGTVLELGVQGLTPSSKWTIFGWFIPLVNVVLPALIMSRIWRASDPNAGLEHESWKRSPFPFFMLVWWILFLTSNLISWGAARSMASAGIAIEATGGDAASIEKFIGAMNLSLFSNKFEIVAILPAIIWVWMLDRRQMRKIQAVARAQVER